MATDAMRLQDLLEIPDSRVPVCLCLDTSGSMMTTEGGTPTGEYTVIDGRRYRVVTGGRARLETLQTGIEMFYDTIYDDEMARYAAEIAVVTFDDTARMLSDFSRVEYNDKREPVPKLVTHDKTSLGLGLNMALDMLERRKEEYKSKGVDYFQPWLVLMTDGEDNGSSSELERARKRIHKLVGEERLCVYPFIIGNESGLETLASLSPKQKPFRIEVTQMKGLFTWLGKSIQTVSSGSVGGNQPPILTERDVIPWDAPLE